MTLRALTEKDFETFILRPQQSVVKFYADWCTDCKRIDPAMPEIVEQFKSHYEFAELDVDANAAIAEKFNVLGIPTFIVFKDGNEVDRLPSRLAKTAEQVSDFLKSHA